MKRCVMKKRPRILRILAGVFSGFILLALAGAIFRVGYAAGMMTDTGGLGLHWMAFRPGFFLFSGLILLLALGSGVFFSGHRYQAVFAGYRQPGQGQPERDIPPIFYEWHRRAHEQETPPAESAQE